MFTRRSEKRNEPKPPSETAILSDHLGVALWRLEDGDMDIRIGEAWRSRNSGVIVRSTFRIGEHLQEFLEVLCIVASACANDPKMSASKRQSILACVSAVETALETIEPDHEHLNGGEKRGILG